ncbi:hypothetical protein NM208_g11806 [Fusarium decemcellulare]|uniref:Uncharacterized protein n=1 Tax=Fusarium decemcellulare TaxID=57161 RepID=A0ACC1RSC9_9HYPO|nr:hypothetical protein NM208_g11806 [Fusarium decemcellulare]
MARTKEDVVASKADASPRIAKSAGGVSKDSETPVKRGRGRPRSNNPEQPVFQRLSRSCIRLCATDQARPRRWLRKISPLTFSPKKRKQKLALREEQTRLEEPQPGHNQPILLRPLHRGFQAPENQVLYTCEE